MHYANSGDPSLPAELGGIVQWIRGLDDFRLQPIALKPSQVAAKPAYTSLTTGFNYIAPEDMAAMYDILPLYNSGITGRGQSIVVVGQTDVNISDIEEFRSYFNLSANDPRMVLVPKTTDPGISATDLPEADIDLEWSGAIARDATIVYVYSQFVMDALDYAINENVAPVITMSYGSCEQLESTSVLNGLRTYARQAAAQGISWLAASGDTGANGCYGQDTARGLTGLSVNTPASVPEVTGLGGTTLNEGGGVYWNATNDGSHASALFVYFRDHLERLRQRRNRRRHPQAAPAAISPSRYGKPEQVFPPMVSVTYQMWLCHPLPIMTGSWFTRPGCWRLRMEARRWRRRYSPA